MPTVMFPYKTLLFEWDTDKYEKVREKHGIAFGEACSVFFDIYEITYADSRFDEMRYVTIGMSDLARLLVIAWTQRNENIRLITAMKAEKSHEQRYRR